MKRSILVSAFVTIVVTTFVFAISFGNMTESVTAAGAGTFLQKSKITIRTENFPRPPYSGATYYIYERNNEVICTKLEVCNKYNNCNTIYKKGIYKDEEDIETGDPYGSTEAVVIAPTKLRRHVCLTKYKLIS